MNNYTKNWLIIEVNDFCIVSLDLMDLRINLGYRCQILKYANKQFAWQFIENQIENSTIVLYYNFISDSIINRIIVLIKQYRLSAIGKLFCGLIWKTTLCRNLARHWKNDNPLFWSIVAIDAIINLYSDKFVEWTIE